MTKAVPRPDAEAASAAYSGYRTSHSAPDYGDRYSQTYQSGYYHHQWIKLERPLVHRLLLQAKDEGARTHLDFACGTGRILDVGLEVFRSSWGVDVSDSMLDIARLRCPAATILRQDITVERLQERFDVVTAFRFFLNAESDLRVEALRSVATLLNDGGCLIANSHVNSESCTGMIYKGRNWLLGRHQANTLGLQEFTDVLREAGFRVVDTYWYGYLPRTGPWLRWIPAVAMAPFEYAWRLLRLPKGMAQCFIVVCKLGQ